MKRIFIIFFVLLSAKALSQSVNGVNGNFVPQGSYPNIWGIHTKGLNRPVADTNARNAIPANFLVNGQFIYTVADSSLWLLDSTQNPIWVLYSQGTIIGNFVTRNTTQTIPSFKTFNPSITIPQGQTNYGVDIIPTFTAGGDTATGIGLHVAPTFNSAGHSNTTFKALQVDNGVTVINGSAYFNRGAGSDLGGINLSRIIQGYSSLDTASWGRKYIGFYDSAGVGWIRINNNHTVAINDSITSHALKVGGTIQTDSLIISKLQTGTAVNSLLVDAGGNVIKGAIGGGGTVTSIATNNGTGITGGTIVSSGTLAIDTTNIISTIANARRIADSAAAAQNITSYRTVYVDSATGNNSTGQVSNPAKPFRTIDAAMAAVPDGFGINVYIGLGIYTSPHLNRSFVRFYGSGRPVFNWTAVTPPSLINVTPAFTSPTAMDATTGTVWTGVFYDSLYNNIELYNLGVDVGKAWCDLNRGGASSDGIMFQHTSTDTTFRKKGIIIMNVSVLGYSSSATSHAILVEATLNPQVLNTVTCYNKYGLVIKSMGGTFTNHTGYGHSYAGLFTKSNGYAPCENVHINGDYEYSVNRYAKIDNGGVNAINQDIPFIRNITYDNIHTDGCQNGFNITGTGGVVQANKIYVTNSTFINDSINGVSIGSNICSDCHFDNIMVYKSGQIGFASTDDTTGGAATKAANTYTNIFVDSSTVWGTSITCNNTVNASYVNNVQAYNSTGAYEQVWFGINKGGYINGARQFGSIQAGYSLQQVMAIGNTSTIAPVFNVNNSYFGAGTSQVNLGTDIIASNWNPQSGGSVLDATKPAWTFTYIPGGSARENFALYTSPNTAINSSVYAIDAVTGKFRINNPSAYATSVTTAQLQVTGSGGIYTNDSLNANKIKIVNPSTGSGGDSVYVRNSQMVKFIAQNQMTGLSASNITTGALPTAQGGVASGGNTGQVLTKNSNTSYDYSWATPASTGISIGSPIGSGTQGSVPFLGTGGIFEQDNANFYWDSTNRRHGIRTNSPSSALHILTTGIATTQSDANGIINQNNTAATSGVPVQYSPRFVWAGTAWNTTSTASNDVRIGVDMEPTSSASPSGSLIFRSSINGGAYGSPLITITTGGSLIAAGNFSASGTGSIGSTLAVTGIQTSSNIDNYAANYGSSYTARTKTDKNYVDSSITSLATASGTYTPTLTGVANVTSTTASLCQYMRIGNTVTVSGKVNITPTASATITTISISLPINSNFTASFSAGGAGGEITSSTLVGATLSANSGSNTLALSYVPANLLGDDIYFSATYRVQ